MTDLATIPAQIASAPIIEEILGHLGAAKMQIAYCDDAIIRDHIMAAHALTLVLFREARKAGLL